MPTHSFLFGGIKKSMATETVGGGGLGDCVRRCLGPQNVQKWPWFSGGVKDNNPT